MAPAFSKLSDPLRQLLCVFLILLPLMLLVQVCEAEKPAETRCGQTLYFMLFKTCKNGFNKKDLDGSLGLLRSRRHVDLFLLQQQFKKQFERASAVLMRGKRRPSLKGMLKEEAHWRRKHQITGKRLRRQVTIGIADECCSSGCTSSDIARYCAGLV